MAKKYKFSDLYNITSFNKGYDAMEKQLVKLNSLQTKNASAGLKGQGQITQNLANQEKQVVKLNNTSSNYFKTLNKLNKQKQRELAATKKVKDATSLEVQVKKELLAIERRRVTAQARTIAAQKAGTKATRTMTQSLKAGFQSLKNYATGMLGMAAAIMALRKIQQTFKEYIQLAEAQILAEQKLTTVLKERTNATDKQVQSIINLAKEQQRLGVLGDEVQLAGAQQLSTFVKNTESIEKMLPAMNNLIVQQKGMNATQNDAVTIANLMGRAFQGQLGSLTRVGISFSEAEGKLLKSNDEMVRAAAIAKIITGNVGEMNKAFAATDLGKIQQAENQIGDLKEEIGEGLIPVMRVFKELTLDSLKNIKTAGEDIAEPIKLIKDLTKNFRDSSDASEDASGKFKEVAASVDEWTGMIKFAIKWTALWVKGIRKLLVVSCKSL